MDDEPQMPEVLKYLWKWFWELDGERDSGFGPSRIKCRDMQAWSEMTGQHLTTWEVKLLRKIDAAYLQHLGEKNKAGKGE